MFSPVFFVFFCSRNVESKHLFSNKFFDIVSQRYSRRIWFGNRSNQFGNLCNLSTFFITQYLILSYCFRKSYYDSATTGKMQNFPYLLQLYL
uniref:Uncharacterized protein n=1 Tax=uncultured marine crenarchaeote HF4000_APKG3B16 TaxID=455583 RepID=B3T761_9ARCH|nr:hypothetical protein ALOHA_HF4000APKG3B16ctg1g13 [uncultured marine crenarchaeote HF4000_APKG3B16]